VRDDRTLFEFLVLEGAQAGLSWDTILAKRENYRRAFDDFDPRKVARYGAVRKRRLLADAGIVRNRAKIGAAVVNAKGVLALQQEYGTFARYLWQFVGDKPLQPRRMHMRDVPARTEISDALSADLKRRGFKFTGSTIMYAFMQAVGVVNDHLTGFFRHTEVAAVESIMVPGSAR
jgi:DNA-3-methyladenine glycosylase I